MGGAGGRGEAAQNRAEIMKMLERREKDAEELDLESCFSELRSKVAGDQAGVEQEIESLANESLRQLDAEAVGLPLQGSASRQMEGSSGSNFYKPQIRTPSMRSK